MDSINSKGVAAHCTGQRGHGGQTQSVEDEAGEKDGELHHRLARIGRHFLLKSP